MTALEPLLQDISALTPLTLALVALAGLIVGIAPSSFPLLSVSAGFFAGRDVAEVRETLSGPLWLTAGFVLGIVTVDAIIGALFGFAGFAVMRVLVQMLPFAYAILAVVLAIMGLALLRVIYIRIPILNPSPKPVQGFVGSYLLGLPFGLSTCPACTPLVLPVVIAAAGTGDPLLGAALMFTFGIARGVPIVLAGTAAGFVKNLRHSQHYVSWVERVGGVLMLAAAVYFVYQAAFYAGWLAPP